MYDEETDAVVVVAAVAEAADAVAEVAAEVSER